MRSDLINTDELVYGRSSNTQSSTGTSTRMVVNLTGDSSGGSTSSDSTSSSGGIFGTKTSTALFTLIILIIIICACGGKPFGGYGNYPGYGGFSAYGYTIPRYRRGYRYNPYDECDD